jgi:hypothetical protein
MGYSVTIPYTYTMSNDQIRVLNISISLYIYHVFVFGASECLSLVLYKYIIGAHYADALFFPVLGIPYLIFSDPPAFTATSNHHATLFEINFVSFHI